MHPTSTNSKVAVVGGVLQRCQSHIHPATTARVTHTAALLVQHEPPFHERYYRELVDLVESRLGAGLSVREKDFQIAMLALRSSKPDAAKALVFSPDVQRLKQEQGEQAAMDYLREVMEEAQQRLREVQQQVRERQRELERE